MIAFKAAVGGMRREILECIRLNRLVYRFTRTEKGKEIRRYWSSARPACPIRAQCTTGKNRQVSRWVHAAVVERAAAKY